MSIFSKILISVFILMVFGMPVLSFAQDSTLIPCGRSVVTKDPQGKIIKSEVPKDSECDFKDFMKLINNVIDFVLFKLALPIAAIMFAYAGVRLITAPGGEGKTKAKNIFLNVVIGIVLAAGAWLIVKTLLMIAGYNDIPLFFK